ncbi:MAG: sodium:proton exchanger [Candidatus Pacebacteria bacterium]|nr:sodium:proton exchanger [Candidatus Paceibacterota bacterium]
MPVFFELALVLGIAVILSFVLRSLKQPLIIAYILTGILVGPSALNLIEAYDFLEVFSEFGITILLFIVGLHLSPNIIKEVGKVSSIAGIGQVIFTSVLGFGILLLLKFSVLESVYLSLALTLSSTIIVLKLLSDRGDLQTLYGKIAIGVLLIQDVIAAIILIVITAFTHTSAGGLAASLTDTLLKGVGLILLMIIISKYILPKITAVASKSSELLFLFSLSWGLGVAALFALLGFSTEIGALAAGVALASSDYTEEISARMRPLRDFFITLFFILLGSQLVLSGSLALLTPVLILSLFVLIGNPLVVIIIMNLLGYERRTGFMTGLTVAQISEFSLILIAFGAKLGHVSSSVLTITTLVGLITIAGSTYLFLYADQIFPRIGPLLALLEWRKQHKKSGKKQELYDILLLGCDDLGSQLIPHFVRAAKSFAIVDYDPEVIAKLKEQQHPHFFGDASNIEFLQELPLHATKLIISNIPDLETNQMLLKFITGNYKDIHVVVSAHSAQDALRLYDAGATYVVWSHAVGADHIQRILSHFGYSLSAFNKRRELELHRIETFLYT